MMVFCLTYMDVFINRGKTPKMDGTNNGNPYFLLDDLGGNTPIFGLTPIFKRLISVEGDGFGFDFT